MIAHVHVGTRALVNEQLPVADVRFVVLDEADQMADMGFMPQVERILVRIDRSAQTLLFIAFRSLWLVLVGPRPSGLSLLVVLGVLGSLGATLSAAAAGAAARNIGGIRVRLAGTEGPRPDQICIRDETEWECGRSAADYLREIIGNQAVRCTVPAEAFGPLPAALWIASRIRM